MTPHVHAPLCSLDWCLDEGQRSTPQDHTDNIIVVGKRRKSFYLGIVCNAAAFSPIGVPQIVQHRAGGLLMNVQAVQAHLPDDSGLGLDRFMLIVFFSVSPL